MTTTTTHSTNVARAIEDLLHAVITKTASEFRSHASCDLTPSISECMTVAERAMARRAPTLARELADVIAPADPTNTISR